MSGGWALSAAVLGTLLLVAVRLAGRHPLRALVPAERRALRVVAGAAVAMQALHFAEELGRGFPVLFPALVRQPPLGRSPFVAFNVAWLAVWSLAIVLAPRGVRRVEWPLWFLAVALTANGVLHPGLALLARGYFPGLFTAVPAGALGLVLLRRLLRLARPVGAT